MKKKILLAICLSTAAFAFTACGGSAEETTEAFETATSPETVAPEYTTEAATEAEEPEVFTVDYLDIMPKPDDFEYALAPALGTTDSRPYRAEVSEDNPDSFTLYSMDFKTIELPEWGIKEMAIEPNLFPDDESSIVKITSDEIWADADWTEQNIEDYNMDTDSLNDYVFYRLNEPYYLDEHGYGSDEYLNVCIDDSVLFPGAFSRRTASSSFRTWRIEVGDIDVNNLEPRELLRKCYPYTEEKLAINPTFDVLERDGYTYVALGAGFTEHWPATSADNVGGAQGEILLRIKDGVCQGFFYTSINVKGFNIGNYIFNYTLNMYDLDFVTGGTICEHVFPK